MSDTIKTLAGSMLTAAQKVVDAAKYDRTRRGIIKSVQSNGYVVDVYGIEYTASGTPGAHKVGDVVSVLFEQNNPDTCLVLNSYVRTAIDDLIMVRPNLLDNWYFVGGGSQQGGGQFPINQRGETNYAGHNVMCADRWVLRQSSSATTSATLTSDGLVFSGDGSGVASGALTGINQTLENKEMYAGKTVTISILVKDVTVSASNICSLRLVSANGRTLHTASHGSVNITGDGLFSRTLTVNPTSVSNYSHLNFGLMVYSNASVSMTIVAAKMEFGNTQTLAHYDATAGEWVLNEISSYQEQLARCQRHLYVMNTYGTAYAPFGSARTTAGTTATALCQLPVIMRTLPALTTSGSFEVVRSTSNGSVSASDFVIDTTGSSTDAVTVTMTLASSVTSNQPGILRAANDTSARLIFSAEL